MAVYNTDYKISWTNNNTNQNLKKFEKQITQHARWRECPSLRSLNLLPVQGPKSGKILKILKSP